MSVLAVAAASGTIVLAAKVRVASAREECKLQIRNIQQAVRSWSGMNHIGISDPIPWNRIIGKGCYINDRDMVHCPSGGDYVLSLIQPEIGQLAAKCPHPEHQKFAHDGW